MFHGRKPNFIDVENCTLLLPCGDCRECLERQSIEWAYRIMDEAKQHKDNCVITLTYDNVNVTEGLLKSDYQKFLKRLRRFLEPIKIRYFCSGEYGSKNLRPHFHIIIFGWQPTDYKYSHTNKHGNKIFTSETVQKIWSNGIVSVDTLNFNTAKYSAKYLQKALKEFSDKYNLQAPFVSMSLKPGLGLRSVDPNKILEDKIYNSGNYIKLPRYYLKLLERDNVDLTLLKKRRKANAKLKMVSINKSKISHDFEKNQRFFGKHLDIK